MTSSKKLIQASAGNVAGGDFYPYTVDNSARFNDNDSAYLYRTPSTAGNRKTWTWSGWVKRGNLGIATTVFQQRADANGSQQFIIRFQSDDTLMLLDQSGGATQGYYLTTALYRDVSAWYHIVVACDTTNATAGDRVKLYVNGNRVTSFSSPNNWPLNYDTSVNNTVRALIGAQRPNSSATINSHFDGYMTEVHFVDGTALDASSFGEDKNGVWIPKSPSVTYGTNGFYLDFSNSAALGTDVSGNGNNFTVSGLTSSDQMIDTPTNNFATFNPLDVLNINNTVILSEGNTRYDSKNSTQVQCTMLPRTGKWYWEVMSPNLYTNGTTGYRGQVGIKPKSATVYDNSLTVRILMGNGYGASVNGRVSKYTTATYKAGAADTILSNDILGIVYDADNLTLEFLINNTSWSVVTGLNDEQCLPWIQADGTPSTSQNTEWNINFGNNGDFNGNKTAQGNTDQNGYGNFYYTPPTGALALCTANFPEPTIGPNSATITSEVFEPILYTGNGTSQSISTLEFQPDFTWIKNRDAADNHMLFDAVRGVTKYLSSNLINAEATDAQSLSSFNSNGFSVGNNVAVNTNAEDYVAWNWKGNGAGVSNTDGSITSTVSANQDAGFSIVTYTGNSTSGATVGHGLGVAPSVVMVKNTSATGHWVTYHKDNGAAYVLIFTTDSLYGPNPTWFNSTEPTSSVFTLGSGTGTNWSGVDTVAYCFAEVEGFSSFGSYTGNGSATEGPFIYTGFRPAWFMLKKTSGTGWWYVFDSERNTYNLTGKAVFPNSDSAESDYPGGSSLGMDFLSNGVKLRGSQTEQNESGQTYIYMAFAENPFKYSNAR